MARAVIVGGGIIGLSTAFYLNADGWDVSVIDQSDFSDNCSYGNMGMIVPSHFEPLAQPGMISQGIKWMFDAKSPFHVKTSLSKQLIGWGLKFMRSANHAHVEKVTKPLMEINVLSKKLYEEWNTISGFDFSLEHKGIVAYYNTEKRGEEELQLAEKARSMGLPVKSLNKKEVQELEPEVQPNVLGGIHYLCDSHLYPKKLMAQLLLYLQKKGVRFIADTKVVDFSKINGDITTVQTDHGNFEADIVVLANGSWLPKLAAKAGIKTPLMPGKGYSFTHKYPGIKLNVPAILCEARVAVTPMNNYMRYGGTMEIGSVKNTMINELRVQGIVNSLQEYFPKLNVQMPRQKELWMGFRPCSPDGVPYIGKSKKLNNLFVAGGHAMMGLSLGPATGKLISEMVKGEKTSIDTEVFSVDRFS